MGKHGTAASEWPGRGHALDRAGEPAMRTKTTAGLQSRARQKAVVQNQRVTARIVREDDGTTRTVYRAHGRFYDSLEALRDALSGRP